MKITKINIYRITSGRLRPVIVEILTDEGITGVGEAGIAYGIGGTAASGMIKDIGDRLLIGRNPSRIQEIWGDIYDHSFWAKNGGPIVFAGISAIEQALWDIKGKALGVPVYEMMGGKVRDSVRVYANGWYGDAHSSDDFASASERPLKDGYTALKFYPLARREGRSLQHPSHRTLDKEATDLAVARVKAVRAAVGADVDIMLDLSGGLTLDQTVRLCERFQEYGVLFIEEPCDPFDDGALERLSNKTTIPIAVGERIYSKAGFRRVFERQAASIIQPDVATSGGLMEVRTISAMAEAYGMRVAPHACGSSVVAAATLQVEANLRSVMFHESYPYFRAEPEHVEVAVNPPEENIRNGFLPIPTGVGLGVEIAKRALQPYLWSCCE